MEPIQLLLAALSGGVVALLDLPDPRPLAKQLALETAIDTPAKAMFGKEVRSEDVRDPVSGKVWIDSAVLNVSNVSSHPGKTLAGCSYSQDLPEDDPEGDAPTPAEGAAPAEPVPAVDAPVQPPELREKLNIFEDGVLKMDEPNKSQ